MLIYRRTTTKVYIGSFSSQPVNHSSHLSHIIRNNDKKIHKLLFWSEMPFSFHYHTTIHLFHGVLEHILSKMLELSKKKMLELNFKNIFDRKREKIYIKLTWWTLWLQNLLRHCFGIFSLQNFLHLMCWCTYINSQRGSCLWVNMSWLVIKAEVQIFPP